MLAEFFAKPAAMIVLTGALVAVSGALLGTFLVLRRSSLLVDAISHSIVFGIVIVWLLTRATSGPVQMIGAGLAGLLTVVLTQLVAATGRVRTDAAIGLVFPGLFALGVLLINLYARDVHIDTHTVLLGEIGFVWLDTLTLGGIEVPRAVVWMGAITAINAVFVTVLFKELKLAAFDPALAAALGLAPTVLLYALLGLTSATAVAAFDAVGAVLFIAFVIVPPAAAYLLTDRLIPMLGLAAAIGVAASASGYAAAVALDVSIGGMMATMTGVFFVAAFALGPRHGLVAQAERRRAQRFRAETRALIVHLRAHEDTARAGEESAVSALQRHLGWGPYKADQVLRRARRRGYVTRVGDRLVLTSAGRQAARDLVAR